ncbi:fluoroquinolone export ABC transporter permease subunit [Paenibacillus wynnii]|uniref:fluoroquinolone export ABC transporter permease subunit n=1 Tax=Paenibacillus wynnii TaxID=268407 RepID=UPI00278F9A00|nr:ABC transporter permease [Paenibacillus wynnii]MDQ0196612.1 fluoroquinolone transport system permease protein [Paenibacillus wynnii]
MRTSSAFAFDVRFQWRHGFYGVYLVVCAFYWVLMHFVPEVHKEKVMVLLTFSDPSALGLIFAGGIILLERDQGIHDSLFVTPIRTREYLLAKAGSFSLLSLLSAWVIHLLTMGIPESPFSFSAGILLTSSFMTLLSIGVVARCQTINSFILLSQVYALPFVLPLLGYFNVWESKLFLLLPTEGTLRLLQSAYSTLILRDYLYSLLVLSVWNYAVYVWARRSYEQHILMRVGSGGAGR